MQEENKDIESRILEAAKEVFVRKGYEATKMGDIASEAGMSRTSLHYYFRTKEMLFEAIFGQLMNNFIPNISLILEKEGTLLEKLPLLIDQYITIVAENPSVPIFFASEINRDYERMATTILKDPERLQPMAKLREQLVKEMEEGKLRKVPLLDVISTFISLVAFPMIARPLITGVFLHNDEKEYEKYYHRRKEVIYEILYNFLAPEQK